MYEGVKGCPPLLRREGKRERRYREGNSNGKGETEVREPGCKCPAELRGKGIQISR